MTATGVSAEAMACIGNDIIWRSYQWRIRNDNGVIWPAAYNRRLNNNSGVAAAAALASTQCQ